jgi:hypothetical protein
MDHLKQLMRKLELGGLAKITLVGSYGRSAEAKDVDLQGFVSGRAGPQAFSRRLLQVLGRLPMTEAKGGWREDEVQMRLEHLQRVTDPLDVRATLNWGALKRSNLMMVDSLRGLEWLLAHKMDELQRTGLKVDLYDMMLGKQVSVIYRWHEPSHAENVRSLERDMVLAAVHSAWRKVGKRMGSLAREMGDEKLAATLEPVRALSDAEAWAFLWELERARALPERLGWVLREVGDVRRLPGAGASG